MDNVDVNVQCPICLEVYVDPYELPCGHMCCKDHIAELSTCPECRSKGNWAPNHFMTRISNAITRPCPHDSCEFKGNRMDVEQHSKSCLYKPINKLKRVPYSKIKTRVKTILNTYTTGHSGAVSVSFIANTES